MPTRRHRSLAFLLVAGSLVVGLVSGRAALVAQDQVSEQYQVLAAALAAIDEKYVGEAPPDRLVYSALNGLMQTLDPHSNFMDPRSYAQTRERQEGRYYGVGVSIYASGGDLIVATVMEDAPAHRAGIRRGDVIARIGGESTKDWTTEQASAKLKGPRGTFVPVSIRRGGYESLIDLQVGRDEVHMPTVLAAVMLDPSTGYIKLDSFGENTDRELGIALRTLTDRGMKRLVFDLRTNPGGQLDQAILVANRFLPRGSLVVYTRGRVQEAAQDYRAQRGGHVTVPMITLVNRNSASASEIVAGALQDHDRSLIVGETTFGKALVQSVYRVSEGAGAAITTARYFTPSGRMIQRPWDTSFDDYLTYSSREQDANPTPPPEDLKFTDAGRRVYSGGGVEPDQRVEGFVDGFAPSRFARTIAARDLFEIYARRFTRQGDTRIPPSTTSPRRELSEDFDVTSEMLAEFKALVMQAPLPFDEAAWKADLPFIAAMMEKEINIDLFSAEAAFRNLSERDPQLRHALTLFPEAEALLALRRPAAVAAR